MNLEDQVCSLELAKQLKELGIAQHNLYAYVISEFGVINGKPYDNMIILTHGKVSNSPNKWKAFTASELMEILPSCFEWNDENGNESCENVYLKITKYPNEYSISYYDHDDQWFDWALEKDKNLPNALAKMLIYLIENNLMTTKAQKSN